MLVAHAAANDGRAHLELSVPKDLWNAAALRIYKFEPRIILKVLIEAAKLQPIPAILLSILLSLTKNLFRGHWLHELFVGFFFLLLYDLAVDSVQSSIFGTFQVILGLNPVLYFANL